MTRVGTHRRVAMFEPKQESAIHDGAGPTEVAGSHQLSIPTRKWKPDLDLDVGVSAGLECSGNSAKGHMIGGVFRIEWRQGHIHAAATTSVIPRITRRTLSIGPSWSGAV